MDKETKEYLERILLGLTTKENLEKLRQETKSNFRQLKEENKNQIFEWRQEVKADFEQLKKEGKVEIDPILKEFREGIQKLKMETRYRNWNYSFKKSKKREKPSWSMPRKGPAQTWVD